MCKDELNIRSSFISLAGTGDEAGSSRSAGKLAQQKPSVVGVSRLAVLHYQFVHSFSRMPPSLC